MSYIIHPNSWGSVFAVPSAVVEQHLKFANEASLKVILYLLKYPDRENTPMSLSKALSVSHEEVENAISFWTERGLILSSENADTAFHAAEKPQDLPVHKEDNDIKAKAPIVTRAVRPDSAFVAQMLKDDLSLRGLLEEAQIALSKPLSSGDTATIVMLYSTFGLPCEVLALLIHFCVSSGKSNMRAIERMGLSWSDKGIYTVELAEEEIKRLNASKSAWTHISSLFGIHNIGNPTSSQLEHADRWMNIWSFSDEMLLEAYERCVNTKGEYNIRYINAILSKWYEKGIKSLDTLKESETSLKKPAKGKKKSAFTFENTSYDVSKHKSLFDD